MCSCLLSLPKLQLCLAAHFKVVWKSVASVICMSVTLILTAEISFTSI